MSMIRSSMSRILSL